MFGMIIKFTFSFVLCFIILSFTIDKKPIFYHITAFTGPVGADIQESLTKSFQTTYSKSKRLFTNSVPNREDSVKSRKSGLKKKEKEIEDLKIDEQRKLDEIIKAN